MATPRVTLKSKTSARGPRRSYPDYRVDGKRMRPNVGASRKDAELVRAKVEQELVLPPPSRFTAPKFQKAPEFIRVMNG